MRMRGSSYQQTYNIERRPVTEKKEMLHALFTNVHCQRNSRKTFALQESVVGLRSLVQECNAFQGRCKLPPSTGCVLKKKQLRKNRLSDVRKRALQETTP